MPQTLRIALAQLNLLVGDITGNAQRVIDAAISARDELKADAILFPELTLTGYPPEDLLLRPGLHTRVLHALETIKREVRGIDVVLGYPRQATGGLYNAASLLRDGQLIASYHKQHLPNYSVFDEKLVVGCNLIAPVAAMHSDCSGRCGAKRLRPTRAVVRY